MSIQVLPSTTSSENNNQYIQNLEIQDMSNEGAYYDEKAKKGADNVGRWTKEEHDLFLEGISRFGKEWKKIASLISTRTVVQVRTHAQKYFQRLSKLGTTTTKEVTQKQGVKRNYDGTIKGESSSSSSKVDYLGQQQQQQSIQQNSQNQQSNQQSQAYHINISNNNTNNKPNKRQAISRKEQEKSPVSVCSIMQEPPPFPYLQEPPPTAMSILQQQQQYQQVPPPPPVPPHSHPQYHSSNNNNTHGRRQQQQQSATSALIPPPNTTTTAATLQQQQQLSYQQCQFQPYPTNASIYQQPPPPLPQQQQQPLSQQQQQQQQPPLPLPTQQTYQQPMEMNEFGYYYPEPIAIIEDFQLNTWNNHNNTEDYPLPSYLEEYNNGFSKYPRMTVFGDDIEQFFM